MYRMEVALIGWPARIVSLIKEGDAFGNKIVEKITEGDEGFVVLHLREPVTDSISLIDTP